MLIEKFGTTRLSGVRERINVQQGACLLQKFTQYTIRKTVGRYMVKIQDMTLPDRHKHTLVQRGTTVGFDRKLPS